MRVIITILTVASLAIAQSNTNVPSNRTYLPGTTVTIQGAIDRSAATSDKPMQGGLAPGANCPAGMANGSAYLDTAVVPNISMSCVAGVLTITTGSPSTNGTNGQVLTSNGSGGFGTALPVTQAGAASSLVKTDSSGGISAAVSGFSSPYWNLFADSNGNMFYQPTVVNTNARFNASPSGTGVTSLVSVSNNSVTANAAKVEIKVAGDTASFQSTHQFGTGLSIVHQLLGEQTNANTLTDIGVQFAGATVQTITPTAITSPTFAASAAAITVGAGQISYGATTVAASNCGSLAGAAGCIVINVAGTTRYVPYF